MDTEFTKHIGFQTRDMPLGDRGLGFVLCRPAAFALLLGVLFCMISLGHKAETRRRGKDCSTTQ